MFTKINTMNIDEHWTFQCLLSCVFPTCLVFDCFAAVHQSPFWFVKGRRVRKLLLLWCILYSYHVLPRSDVHFAASRSFFPPCQVRVVRFYVSCPAFRLPSAFLRLPSGLNCKLAIAVVPAGPQPQRISEDVPNRMPERLSEDMPDTHARKYIR